MTATITDTLTGASYTVNGPTVQRLRCQRIRSAPHD